MCAIGSSMFMPPAGAPASLAEQRGWSAKEVAARENAQLALTDKVSRADFAVDNSGPPEEPPGKSRNCSGSGESSIDTEARKSDNSQERSLDGPSKSATVCSGM